MRAVVFERHGGLDELKWVDVRDPIPDAGEVLVRVRACALNHLDIWEREGLPGLTLPFPHISGSDIAGEVMALGPKVTGIKTGERVVLSPGISCGACEFCRKDFDSLCAAYEIMGLQRDGGYAEVVKAPSKAVIPVSSRLSFEEWASIPLVFLTAWHMLVTRAHLDAGETVLVHAAGSGIGMAAIQVAKHLGATVITTASGSEKLEKAKALKADFGIDYKRRDFVKEVRKFTQDRGVDVVFEHIGLETWTGSLKCLAKGGRLVTCGATSGREISMDLRFLFVKQLSLLGSYMGGSRELGKVLELAERGALKPTVDSVFPLKEARKAQEKMLRREQFGKIVLVPS